MYLSPRYQEEPEHFEKLGWRGSRRVRVLKPRWVVRWSSSHTYCPAAGTSNNAPPRNLGSGQTTKPLACKGMAAYCKAFFLLQILNILYVLSMSKMPGSYLCRRPNAIWLQKTVSNTSFTYLGNVKKNQQLFLWAFFEEPHLYDRGGSASPPPASNRVKGLTFSAMTGPPPKIFQIQADLSFIITPELMMSSYMPSSSCQLSLAVHWWWVWWLFNRA